LISSLGFTSAQGTATTSVATLSDSTVAFPNSFKITIVITAAGASCDSFPTGNISVVVSLGGVDYTDATAPITEGSGCTATTVFVVWYSATSAYFDVDCTYTPDDSSAFHSSTCDTVNINISPAPTQIALVSDPPSTTYGTSFAHTSTVTSGFAQSLGLSPDGKVNFTMSCDGTQVWTQSIDVAADEAFNAVSTTDAITNLNACNYTLTASYVSGSQCYYAIQTAVLYYNVGPVSTGLSFNIGSQSPADYGTTLNIVGSVNSLVATPSGSITFTVSQGSTQVCSITATLTESSTNTATATLELGTYCVIDEDNNGDYLVPGTYAITLAFLGSLNFAPSQTSSQTLIINKATPDCILSFTTTNGVPTSWKVACSEPRNQLIPSGSFSLLIHDFWIDSFTLGPDGTYGENVTNIQGTLNPSSGTCNPYDIHAQYGGDDNFVPTTSDIFSTCL